MLPVGRTALAAIWVMAMVMCLPVHGIHDTSTTTPSSPTPTRDVYASYNSGLAAAYKTANFFLGEMVQTKYLTDMKDKVNFESWETITESFKDDGWEDWTVYFIGFVICAAVGVLMVLIMIILAITLPCCRCCGNCGGSPDMRDRKRSGCARTGCAVALLVMCMCIVLGVIPMFAASDEIHKGLVGDQSMWDVVGDSVLGTEQYLNSAISSLDTEAYQDFHNTSSRLINDLLDLPQDGMEALDNQTQVFTAFNSLSAFTNELVPLNSSLSNITELTLELETYSANLTLRLEEIKNATLTSLVCTNNSLCDKARASVADLVNTANYSSVDVTLAHLAVSAAIQANLTGMVGTIGNELNKILNDINSTTYAAVDKANNELTKADDKMSKALQDLRNIVTSIKLSEVATDIKAMKSKDNMDAIADGTQQGMWAVAALLCLIVLCNVLGVLFGGCCHRPDPNEGACACSRNQGARWLLGGTGVTLLFYWLLTLILIAFFFSGGPAYTEVCRHVLHFYEPKSEAVLKLMDTTINGSIGCSGNECFHYDIMPFESYARCEKNVSMYSALNLEQQGLNISDILNPAQLQPFIDDIKNLNISLPPVNLITPALNSTLVQLEEAMNLDFKSMYYQLSQQPIDSRKLNTAIEDLIALNDPALSTHISDLQALSSSHLVPMSAIADIITDLLGYVEKTSNISFVGMAQIFSNAEVFINVNGDVFVSDFIAMTVDDVYMEVVQLSTRVIHAVEYDIGNCGPLYSSLWSAFHATCADMLFPVNAFAFCLGWCLFFLLPSLILALKLVTLYRKTDTYYDGDEFDYHAGLIPPNHYDPPVNAYERQQFNNPMMAPIPAIDNPVFDPDEGYNAKEGLTLPRPKVYPHLDARYAQDSRPPSYPAGSVPGYYYPGPPPEY